MESERITTVTTTMVVTVDVDVARVTGKAKTTMDLHLNSNGKNVFTSL